MKVYFLYFFRSQLQLTTSMTTLLSLLIRPKTLKLARPLDLEVSWSRFLHRMRIWVLPAKLCTISRTETQMVRSYYHKHSCLVAILTSLKHRSRKLHASTVTRHAFFQQQTLPISSGILVLFFGNELQWVLPLLLLLFSLLLKLLLSKMYGVWNVKLQASLIRMLITAVRQLYVFNKGTWIFC